MVIDICKMIILQIILLVLAQLVCLIAIKPIPTCPLLCECIHHQINEMNMNEMSCKRSHLKYIPNTFNFRDIKIFNLSDNSISYLGRHSFHNAHFHDIEILDLQDNAISTISSKAFYPLKSLLEIDLSNNNLTFFNGSVFRKNQFLNKILLRDNPIKILPADVFPFSIYLHHLDVERCEIASIDDNAFVNTPMLQYINLRNNKLSSLSVKVMHESSQIRQFYLNGNPWKCNEQLWTLLKWLLNHNISGDTGVLCIFAESNNTIYWDTMNVRNPTKHESHSNMSGLKKVEWKPLNNNKSRRRRNDDTDEDNSQMLIDIPSEIQVESSNIENQAKLDNVNEQNFQNDETLFQNVNSLQKTTFSGDNKNDDGSVIHIDSENVGDTNSYKFDSQTSSDDISSPAETDENDYKSPSTTITLDMNVLLGLIVIEFSLLFILLYILYKLWKWNRKHYNETGVNVSIKCAAAKGIESNENMNSPGYKRYSLSDETSTEDNMSKDGKYERNRIESGYISCSRNNSSFDGELANVQTATNKKHAINNLSTETNGNKNQCVGVDRFDKPYKCIYYEMDSYILIKNSKGNSKLKPSTYRRSLGAENFENFHPKVHV